MKKLLLISEIECAVIRRKIRTLFQLAIEKTEYKSTIKVVFDEIENKLISLPYAFSKNAITETLYEIVQTGKDKKEVSHHPKKFKSPEEAIAEYEAEYKNRKKGDNYSEYWRNVPVVIRKVITTTEVVKEYNQEPSDHDWFKKDGSKLSIIAEVNMSELLTRFQIQKVKALLEHSDLEGVKAYLNNPLIKKKIESKGVSCERLYRFILNKISFFI
jgi:hypothetical protein